MQTGENKKKEQPPMQTGENKRKQQRKTCIAWGKQRKQRKTSHMQTKKKEQPPMQTGENKKEEAASRTRPSKGSHQPAATAAEGAATRQLVLLLFLLANTVHAKLLAALLLAQTTARQALCTRKVTCNPAAGSNHGATSALFGAVVTAVVVAVANLSATAAAGPVAATAAALAAADLGSKLMQTLPWRHVQEWIKLRPTLSTQHITPTWCCRGRGCSMQCRAASRPHFACDESR